MIVNFDIENLFYGFLYCLYPGIAKLHYFTCICENNVVVLFVEIGFFVVGLVLAKLVFSYQVTFQ